MEETTRAFLSLHPPFALLLPPISPSPFAPHMHPSLSLSSFSLYKLKNQKHTFNYHYFSFSFAFLSPLHPHLLNNRFDRQRSRESIIKNTFCCTKFDNFFQMESTIANPVASSSNRARESRRRKKKIKTHHSQSSNTSQSQKTSWKSDITQQIYSSKLLQALRQVRLSSPPSTAVPRRGRAVREAADRVLAIAARGRTRWSRAILTNRIRFKFMNKKHKRQRVNQTGLNRSPRKKPRLEILRLKGKNIPAMQRKVKTLGKLVPGCKKETLPVILEEATDYIPALEMQIRAMREVLSRLSASGEGSSSEPPVTENGSV